MKRYRVAHPGESGPIMRESRLGTWVRYADVAPLLDVMEAAKRIGYITGRRGNNPYPCIVPHHLDPEAVAAYNNALARLDGKGGDDE